MPKLHQMPTLREGRRDVWRLPRGQALRVEQPLWMFGLLVDRTRPTIVAEFAQAPLSRGHMGCPGVKTFWLLPAYGNCHCRLSPITGDSFDSSAFRMGRQLPEALDF